MTKKILIVDDEPDLLKVVTFRLKKTGYEIISAIDGQEAWDLIQADKPDFILLDLRVPLISGVDLCKKIKSDQRFKTIPVVLFTASADGVAEKAKDAGADDYLLKPFTPEELLSKIKKFVG